MTEEIPIAVVKCKVGPLLERYRNGAFESVERERNGIKRVAVCGLDNSHNGDYKVAYASDPLLVLHAEGLGYTHDQLRDRLEETGLWFEEFQAVEIPHGDGWYAGFKSLPRSANRLGLFRSRLERVKVSDSPLIDGDNHVNAWV